MSSGFQAINLPPKPSYEPSWVQTPDNPVKAAIVFKTRDHKETNGEESPELGPTESSQPRQHTSPSQDVPNSLELDTPPKQDFPVQNSSNRWHLYRKVKKVWPSVEHGLDHQRGCRPSSSAPSAGDSSSGYAPTTATSLLLSCPSLDFQGPDDSQPRSERSLSHIQKPPGDSGTKLESTPSRPPRPRSRSSTPNCILLPRVEDLAKSDHGIDAHKDLKEQLHAVGERTKGLVEGDRTVYKDVEAEDLKGQITQLRHEMLMIGMDLRELLLSQNITPGHKPIKLPDQCTELMNVDSDSGDRVCDQNLETQDKSVRDIPNEGGQSDQAEPVLSEKSLVSKVKLEESMNHAHPTIVGAGKPFSSKHHDMVRISEPQVFVSSESESKLDTKTSIQPALFCKTLPHSISSQGVKPEPPYPNVPAKKQGLPFLGAKSSRSGFQTSTSSKHGDSHGSAQRYQSHTGRKSRGRSRKTSFKQLACGTANRRPKGLTKGLVRAVDDHGRNLANGLRRSAEMMGVPSSFCSSQASIKVESEIPTKESWHEKRHREFLARQEKREIRRQQAGIAAQEAARCGGLPSPSLSPMASTNEANPSQPMIDDLQSLALSSVVCSPARPPSYPTKRQQRNLGALSSDPSTPSHKGEEGEKPMGHGPPPNTNIKVDYIVNEVGQVTPESPVRFSSKRKGMSEDPEPSDVSPFKRVKSKKGEAKALNQSNPTRSEASFAVQADSLQLLDDGYNGMPSIPAVDLPNPVEDSSARREPLQQRSQTMQRSTSMPPRNLIEHLHTHSDADSTTTEAKIERMILKLLPDCLRRKAPQSTGTDPSSEPSRSSPVTVLQAPPDQPTTSLSNASVRHSRFAAKPEPIAKGCIDQVLAMIKDPNVGAPTRTRRALWAFTTQGDLRSEYRPIFKPWLTTEEYERLLPKKRTIRADLYKC